MFRSIDILRIFALSSNSSSYSESEGHVMMMVSQIEDNVAAFWKNYEGFCRTSAQSQAFVDALALSDTKMYVTMRHMMFPAGVTVSSDLFPCR